ncbi:MAG: hypothetical protein IID32_06945, partial [Planctomycetes bacterium]|nr:hypothetical protein [Planctomycetota bacterium]
NPAQQGALDQTPETAGTDTLSPGDDSETLAQAQSDPQDSKEEITTPEKNTAPGEQTQTTDEQEIQTDPQDIQQDIPQDPKAENAEAFSFPVRLLLKTLQAVNKPFGFVNESTRQSIGLVAVITFMMTMITIALLLLTS